jgi:asparagine synthase (glutamine-hydrolysing)
MSGIAGILRFDGRSVERHMLERMLQPLSARGPHGRESYVDSSAGLGHTLLEPSVEKSRQVIPLFHADQQLILTFDGRLDNRTELLDLLKSEPREHSYENDAGLILAAYEKWGEACPKHLLGDFSFALRDRKKNSLFCARDHLGVKPFYYHFSGKFFIFASSPYAIIAAYPELGEVNEERIADYLADFEGLDETSTFYKHICRLPHGRSLTVTDHDMKISAYWDLQPAVIRYGADADQVEVFQQLFSESVRCRLGTPDGTVVPLSGGIDSTSIASVARKIFRNESNSSLITISALAADNNDTEAERIRSVISQGDLRFKTFSLDYILQHATELISHLAQADEPFDNLDITWRSLYKQAQEDNIHVSLDGVDADGLLSGAQHIAILWRSGKYREFLGETIFAGGLTAVFHKHPLILMLKSLGSILAPKWLRKVRRSIYDRTLISRFTKQNLIEREFADRIRLMERYQLFISHTIPPDSATQIDAHKKSIGHPHLQAALERYDRTASSYSIEPRHPFLDVRLVEFCLGLPWQLKTHQGWTKMILRQAMAASLPDMVVWGKERKHPNWGFSLQLLMKQKAYFGEILNDEREKIKAYIDINRLDLIWNRFVARGSDEEAYQIWSVIGLIFWLRRQENFYHQDAHPYKISNSTPSD